MAFQTPPTFYDGDVLSASQLNILAANQNELAGLASMVNTGFAQVGIGADTSKYYRVVHAYNNLFLKFGEWSSASELKVYYGATLVYTSPGNGAEHEVNVDLSTFGLTIGQPYTVRLRTGEDDGVEMYYLSESEETL